MCRKFEEKMGKRNAFFSAEADQKASTTLAEIPPVDGENSECTSKQQEEQASRRGFTLTELLVVIGIIAALIAVLLPALTRARQASNRVACMENLRSIGQAITMYAGQWHGSLPEGLSPDGNDTWVSLLAYNMSWETVSTHLQPVGTGVNAQPGMGSADMNKNLSVFLCPDANPFSPTPTSDYSCHPMLMPSMTETYGTAKNAFPESSLQNTTRLPYKITKIPNPTDIVLIFDGSQAMGGDGAANPEGKNIDDNRISNVDKLNPTNPGVTFLIAGYNPAGQVVDLGQSVDGGLNLDGPPTTNNANVRWRHMGNTMANFLYVDGHCDSLHYNSEFNTELLRSNVYIPAP
jgi:prepilin-type N-terminal cleavage/methylation domain-containing protein/prepilin-type processing-associated H-X9-DG protein